VPTLNEVPVSTVIKNNKYGFHKIHFGGIYFVSGAGNFFQMEIVVDD
jgi:hypothetical protein